MKYLWTLTPVLALACGLALLPAPAAEPAKKVGPSAEEWDRVVEKGIRFLKTAQAEDGTWSKAKSPGVTGIALTGMLQTGKVSPQDPAAQKALNYIESLVNPKAGHIAGQDPKPQLQNYVTCVNVLALTAAGSDTYKEVLGDAAKFLNRLQWDEEEGQGHDSDFYGGAGYDSKSRPDLSNAQFCHDALKAAGVGKDDPAVQKAITFVSRCQNLKGETNDQPWAGKYDDGSFIYSAAGGGQSKA